MSPAEFRAECARQRDRGLRVAVSELALSVSQQRGAVVEYARRSPHDPIAVLYIDEAACLQARKNASEDDGGTR